MFCQLASQNQSKFIFLFHLNNLIISFYRDLEITTSLDAKAPEPVLKVSVKQGGNLVSGDLNVSPGTPLQMEIYLDADSAPVYGLGVSVMEVTDTKTQEETIIFNG